MSALLLGGCGYGASRLSHEAQFSMIGMGVNDLEACAGPPDKTTRIGAAEIFTYEYKPTATGGLTVTLPLELGGVALGGSGTYCRADFRLVADRVTELHYTGDDDKTIGSDGVCAPLVRGCLRQFEPTMTDPTHAWSRASAFGSPPVPPQPVAGEVPSAPAEAGKPAAAAKP